MSKLLKALRLIAVKNDSDTGGLAAGLMVDSQRYSISTEEYNEVIVKALNDNVEYTQEERELLVSCLEIDEDAHTRNFMLRVRLTESERDKLQLMTQNQGFNSISKYVRFKLFQAEDVEKRKNNAKSMKEEDNKNSH